MEHPNNHFHNMANLNSNFINNHYRNCLQYAAPAHQPLLNATNNNYAMQQQQPESSMAANNYRFIATDDQQQQNQAAKFGTFSSAWNQQQQISSMTSSMSENQQLFLDFYNQSNVAGHQLMPRLVFCKIWFFMFEEIFSSFLLVTIDLHYITNCGFLFLR